MTSVRKAHLVDVDEIVTLWNVFMEEHRELGIEYGEDVIPHLKEDAPKRVVEYYKRNIRSKNGLLLVLEDKGVVRGYMLCQIMKNIPVFSKENVGYLASVFIQRHYRGKGYSSQMFHKAREWFERKGITEISLNVMYCNPIAKEIYRKWGFKDIHYNMRLDMDR